MSSTAATRKFQFAAVQNYFGLGIHYTTFGIAAGVLDVICTVVASLCAHEFYRVTAPGSYGFHSLGNAACLGVITGLLYLTGVRSAGLYGLSALLHGKKLLLRTSFYAFSSVLFLMVFLFLTRSGPDVSRGTFLFFVPLQLSLLIGSRLLSIRLAKTFLSTGRLAGPSALVFGDERELQHLSHKYLLSEFGLKEVARVTIDEGDKGIEGSLSAALALSRTVATEKLVVAVDWNDERKLATIRESLRRSALPALLLPDATVRRVSGQCIGLPQRTAVRAITLQRGPMTTTTVVVKRVLDMVFAASAIVALAPIMALAALAIRSESSGPIIFRQRRHGFDRRPFTIFKFRSMTVLEDGYQIKQATRGDDRLTKVGAFLRRSSIDELPQLFNVLLGHMSLVGPRPHALAHDNIYSDLIDRYSFRHHVKPGITGWAQINGARGQTQAVEQMKRRVELDLWYIDHCSIWLDLFILARTCISVLRDDAF